MIAYFNSIQRLDDFTHLIGHIAATDNLLLCFITLLLFYFYVSGLKMCHKLHIYPRISYAEHSNWPNNIQQQSPFLISQEHYTVLERFKEGSDLIFLIAEGLSFRRWTGLLCVRPESRINTNWMPARNRTVTSNTAFIYRRASVGDKDSFKLRSTSGDSRMSL